MTAVTADQEPVAAPAPESVRKMLVDLLPVLREVARGLRGRETEVEDLVQDTAERALRSIEAVNLARNPRGWLVTILRNLHIDRCREKARRLPHVPSDDDLLAPEPTAPPAWSLITTQDLRAAAMQLPDELRAAYLMFAFDGRSYTEISAALGIPKPTVGTRLLRARLQLKTILTARVDPEDP